MSVKFTSKGLADGTDSTKELEFNVSGVTTGTTRTITVPNESGTMHLGVGIDDNATSTAVTIDSSGNVGIGTSSPGEHLSVEGSGSQAISIYSTDTGVQSAPKTFIKLYGENTSAYKKLQAQIASAPGHSASSAGELQFFTADSSSVIRQRMTIREDGNVGIGVVPESWSASYKALQVGDTAAMWQGASNNYLTNNTYYNGGYKYQTTSGASHIIQISDGSIQFGVAPSGTADSAISWTTAMTITNDGRGLSQFTAKAWVNFNGTGTVAIRDSHNVSSITDNGTGDYTVNFTNAMANANYSVGLSSARTSAGLGYQEICWLAKQLPTTSNFRVSTGTSHHSGSTSGIHIDHNVVCANIFGD